MPRRQLEEREQPRAGHQVAGSKPSSTFVLLCDLG